MEENKELHIQRTFNAPKEKVWKYWTDPQLVAQWWGPKGVTNPTCVWDAKPKGTIHIVMLAGEELGPLKGQEWPMMGEFIEVVKPEKLVYSANAIVDGKPVLETLTTVSLSDDNGKTILTIDIIVTKTTPEAEGPLKGMKMGWMQQIDKLEESLK